MALVNVQKTYTLNAIIANKEYTVKDVVDLLQVAKMQGVRISVKEAERPLSRVRTVLRTLSKVLRK